MKRQIVFFVLLISLSILSGCKVGAQIAQPAPSDPAAYAASKCPVIELVNMDQHVQIWDCHKGSSHEVKEEQVIYWTNETLQNVTVVWKEESRTIRPGRQFDTRGPGRFEISDN